MGIFAWSEIKKGEEITFDYQFESVGKCEVVVCVSECEFVSDLKEKEKGKRRKYEYTTNRKEVILIDILQANQRHVGVELRNVER